MKTALIMNIQPIKSKVTAVLLTVILLGGFGSCTIDDQTDPNGPSQEALEEDATVDELNNLVAGMESGLRNRFDTYLDGVGVIGREFYRFSGADPRFTSDLLGKGAAELDDNTFYTVNPWNDRYRVIRNGWILRHAVDNTSAALSDEQKNGYRGFAKTMQAVELLFNAIMQYDNGVRPVDAVEDPDNLGGFTGSFAESLNAILSTLDEGYEDLLAGGDEFSFILSHGFDGFNTPGEFAKFNRGLAARINLYQNDWNGALANIGLSFIDFAGSMNTGVYQVYSTAGGDIANDMFFAQNSSPGGNARCVHPSWTADAEAGDLRLSKASLRDVTAFQDDLSSDYDLWVWKSNVDPYCIIRNEELLLIYAEASNETGNLSEATNSVNIVRTVSGGLAAVSGLDQAAMRDEILKQRRYSLFAEGFRWNDMRRLNRLNELPIDRTDDTVFDRFPRPAAESF